MSYAVLLHPDVDAFLKSLDEKSERICRDNLAYLQEHPYPGGVEATKRGSSSTAKSGIDNISVADTPPSATSTRRRARCV